MATVKEKIAAQRKRKPKQLAVINENCTGCAGSPVCQDYCPVDHCMVLIKDEVAAPSFGRIVVNPLLCIGCAKCTSKGPGGAYLDGCPWGAIDMFDIKVWEAKFGELPY